MIINVLAITTFFFIGPILLWEGKLFLGIGSMILAFFVGVCGEHLEEKKRKRKVLKK